MQVWAVHSLMECECFTPTNRSCVVVIFYIWGISLEILAPLHHLLQLTHGVLYIVLPVPQKPLNSVS